MNTFLLAAVAIGLVAFLVFKRKRQAAAGAAPAKERAPKRSRTRGRAKTRRDGTIQGYPDPAPEAAAAAMAETAASHTLSPVLEPLPPAAPAPPPAEPAAPPPDWGFDEMIVEPGWPMPGEIAGAWPAGDQAPNAPVAASPTALVIEEPVAMQVDSVVDEAATGEWEMPATAPYVAPEPDLEPIAPEPQAEAPSPWGEPEAEPAMETWVPGVSEVEPVVLPDPEPIAAAEAEPALVWADPAPVADADAEPEPEPVEYVAEPVADAFPVDEVAGPPAWQREPAVAAVEEPPAAVEALAAWELEPVAAPAPVAVEEPWQPVAEPASEPVAFAEADPDAEIDAVTEGLPLAVAALTPVIATGDALGVTPRMATVLRALADEPRGMPGLGRALGVSRPVVADVCARLEDLELVWRERDPDDRRRMIVIPTLKGLKLAEEAVPGLDREAVAGALGRLSPTERTALVSAVRALREDSSR